MGTASRVQRVIEKLIVENGRKVPALLRRAASQSPRLFRPRLSVPVDVPSPPTPRLVRRSLPPSVVPDLCHPDGRRFADFSTAFASRRLAQSTGVDRECLPAPPPLPPPSPVSRRQSLEAGLIPVNGHAPLLVQTANAENSRPGDRARAVGGVAKDELTTSLQNVQNERLEDKRRFAQSGARPRTAQRREVLPPLTRSRYWDGMPVLRRRSASDRNRDECLDKDGRPCVPDTRRSSKKYPYYQSSYMNPGFTLANEDTSPALSAPSSPTHSDRGAADCVQRDKKTPCRTRPNSCYEGIFM
jgi:hypothetical protein